MVTYYILATYNIRYTPELITIICICILYFNVYFKPNIVKNSIFYICVLVHKRFVTFVTHLPMEGRKNCRKM